MKNKNILSEFDLSDEDKQKLLEEIKYYFEQERDEKIGIIASGKLLEFFLNTMGKYIYNKALDDIKKWYDKRMENIETDFFAMYKTE
ncbi:MAG TPA: DUF2164 domain-containing protein [Halanaerobiales bacterium]|nr:DUF2164 domain-containing protein [Halanaerobiales bacterium]